MKNSLETLAKKQKLLFETQKRIYQPVVFWHKTVTRPFVFLTNLFRWRYFDMQLLTKAQKIETFLNEVDNNLEVFQIIEDRIFEKNQLPVQDLMQSLGEVESRLKQMQKEVNALRPFFYREIWFLFLFWIFSLWTVVLIYILFLS